MKKDYEEHSHEERDVKLDVIIRVFLWLIVAGVAIHVAVWFLFERMRLRFEEANLPMQGVVSSEGEVRGPKLQANPYADLDRIRAEEIEKSVTYGWADREKGIVRMPVEEAMDLVVQKGVLKGRKKE